MRATGLATIVVLGLGGLGSVGPSWATAPDPARALQSVEERLESEREAREALRAKREALAAELRSVRDQVIESAAAIQEAETRLSTLEERLSSLRDERNVVAAALSMRDTQMAHVLTAIQRLAWRPTEALVVQPAPPADTVRSAILLGAAIPRIRENARALARELETLRALDTAITEQRAAIVDEGASLRSAHARLEDLFDRKAALQRHTLEQEREAAVRVERLGREAADLRDLIRRLEEERKRREALAALRRAEEARRAAAAEAARRAAAAEAARAVAEAQAAAEAEEAARAAADAVASAPALAPVSESATPTVDSPPDVTEVAMVTDPGPLTPLPEPMTVRAFATGKGAMPIPARGSIVTRYGQPDALGGASKGLTVNTRAGAQVVAPFDGTVAFAGPFRGYGLLLIIEHTDGYHSLLAGMDRLDGHVGQAVRAGEPIGVMGENNPSLYIELRRDGRPINPLPWLAAGTDTGKG
ncbi:murein hydrolase activator EnvC family protein [Roseospira marina]|uniref:murein hydrolase activator EnvC family protein n=1 Tax=Roseospira marina TaxID=140057 RepID=UPI0014782EF9|nr:peptidoglycan DD-metalloendopeptidase family protein [Roseospira marina]MBB4312327.1 septal ring factor EnvC (AmiA/AmiB activator) [Roseospira marina]